MTTPNPFRALLAAAAPATLLVCAACGGTAPGAAPTTTRPALGAGATTTGAPATTATTAAPTTTSSAPGGPGPVTSPPLPKPGPGFVADHVTAIGDSVMIDYQDPLEHDIPGITVDAAVSRQWSTGEAVLQQDKAAGQLGAVVIVGLGTNGPITAADFDAMMTVLSGASRVVFVTTHVDRPWQDQVNQVLEQGATRYPNVVIADWASLADQNPGWLYSDQTHLPIDGPGADALAALVASKA